MLVLFLGLSLCSTAAGSTDNNVSFYKFLFNVCIFALVYLHLSASVREIQTPRCCAVVRAASFVAISFSKEMMLSGVL